MHYLSGWMVSWLVSWLVTPESSKSHWSALLLVAPLLPVLHLALLAAVHKALAAPADSRCETALILLRLPTPSAGPQELPPILHEFDVVAGGWVKVGILALSNSGRWDRFGVKSRLATDVNCT